MLDETQEQQSQNDEVGASSPEPAAPVDDGDAGAGGGDPAEPVSELAQEAEEDGVHQLHAEPRASEPETDDGGPGWGNNLHRMLNVPLSLTVRLGGTEMPLSDVLGLEAGSVITIDRTPGEPIELLINGRIFARGEVVVIDDTFGYRITELADDAAEKLTRSARREDEEQ